MVLMMGIAEDDMIWKRAAKKWYRVALSWQAWGEAHQADADRLRDVIWKLEKQLDEVGKMSNRRLELMRYVEKHKKVCMFCYTRYHTDDCKWAKELRDAKK